MKENSLKERKSFSLFSKQNSRTNLPFKIKRKSIGAFSLHRNHYSDVRRNSSSIVQTSEPESEVNISNDISMEEEKMNKNDGQEYSEDKISNNNESNFSKTTNILNAPRNTHFLILVAIKIVQDINYLSITKRMSREWIDSLLS